jgi:crotonobetainyl-CoA:carnitine CoA-transferase CaiB-like acyl-CoA transferase
MSETPERPARRPLDGILVVDFSQIVAGPLAAMVLSDLGARVVKVEPPGGDAARQLGNHPGRRYYGMFDSFNRGKESLVLDLTAEQGREQARRLVSQADVLIEASRVGVMDRLGLGADELRARHPRLVYVSINAYGERGKDAQRGGVDVAIQAETGWMSITGEPDGPPMKIGSVPIDAATGHVAAQGALAALFARERTGTGDVVRVSLYDVACSLHTHDFTDYRTLGWVARRSGNFPAATTPSGIYETADGTMVLSAYMPNHWAVAQDILDDDRLRDDPRFASMRGRVEHREDLLILLKEVMRKRSTAEWMERFSAARITSGVVKSTDEVAESEQFASSALGVELKGDEGREVRTIRTPARFDSFTPSFGNAAPDLDSGWDALADLLTPLTNAQDSG